MQAADVGQPYAMYAGPSPCDSDPCQNGGICVADKQTFTYECDCDEKHTGRHCQFGIRTPVFSLKRNLLQQLGLFADDHSKEFDNCLGGHYWDQEGRNSTPKADSGEGILGEPPPSQLGGLGERCKLPSGVPPTASALWTH